MKKTYSPCQFGILIGKTTKTLQRWDRKNILKAHRSITDRRYYTHDQYVQVTGQKAKKRKFFSAGLVHKFLDNNNFVTESESQRN